MGWETRIGGRYFYRKERIGGRVVSRYVGRNETAQLISQFETARRRDLALYRRVEAKRRADFEALEAASDEAFETAQSLVNLALVALGFHQHKRMWRRRRDGEEAETE